MIEAVKTANCIMTDEEFEEAFDTESPPTFFDFFSFQTKDFNILAFNEATENWYENERKRQLSGKEVNHHAKRPYTPREQKIRRDPKTSFWWIDYGGLIMLCF